MRRIDYHELAVPFPQSQSLTSRSTFRILHWTWHPAHPCAKRFTAGSILRRFLCLRSRHRWRQSHTLCFSRGSTFSVQTASRILAFLALPCSSLSHVSSSLRQRYLQGSDMGDQPFLHEPWQRSFVLVLMAWIFCLGFLFPKMLSFSQQNS